MKQDTQFRKFLLGECNSSCSVTDTNEGTETEKTNVLEQKIYFSDLSQQIKDAIINRIELGGGDASKVIGEYFPFTLNLKFAKKDNSVTEASEEDINSAFELVGGTVVAGKGLEFKSVEEVKVAKSILDSKEIASYTSNRTPLILFIGMPATTATGKYGMGPFAAEVLKAVESNPSAKKELDKLVADKKAEVKPTYTGSELETIFSRMELKKYSKILQSVPNKDEGEDDIDAGEVDAKLMEFRSMFSEYDNPVDMIIDKFKNGENIIPYLRIFNKHGWVTKKEILAVANANGYSDLITQLEAY